MAGSKHGLSANTEIGAGIPTQMAMGRGECESANRKGRQENSGLATLVMAAGDRQTGGKG
jgi:hypothetical protein